MNSNAYLCEYAKNAVANKCPYWYACFGQISSASLLAEKRRDNPKYYTATDYASQFGRHVYDCAGLIKGAAWTTNVNGIPKYKASEDWGATTLYNKASKKGKIDTFDKVNGRCVFRGNDKTKTHVGVYCDGRVYHAKGHAYGCISEAYDPSKWQYWAQCSLFDDSNADGGSNDDNNEQPELITVELPVLKYGSRGGEVKSIQALLNGFGFRDQNGAWLAVDGIFGVKTQYAVTNYQRARNLTVCGIVNEETWNKILK